MISAPFGFYSALNPKTAQISFTPRVKPEFTQVCVIPFAILGPLGTKLTDRALWICYGKEYVYEYKISVKTQSFTIYLLPLGYMFQLSRVIIYRPYKEQIQGYLSVSCTLGSQALRKYGVIFYTGYLCLFGGDLCSWRCACKRLGSQSAGYT